MKNGIIMKISMTVLILLVFTGISFADVESNNSKDAAEVLQLNSTVAGNIGYENESGKDFYDWYKITLPSDGRLDVSLDATGNVDYLHLYYINANNSATNMHHGTDGDGSNGYSVYGEDLAKGTYYVMIDYGSAPVDYTLTNTFTAASKGNDEPDSNTNDSKDAAATMEINTSKEGHIGYMSDRGVRDSYDWYKITLPSDGRLDVSLDATGKVDYLHLYYINANNSATNMHNGTDSDGSNGYSVYGEDLAKGTYYVMIDYGSVPVDYTLTNTFTAASKGNDEPDSNTNDSKDAAATMEINTSKEGHIGYMSDRGVRDNYDWYKITLPSDGRLDVSLEATGKVDYLHLYYINANNSATNMQHGTDSDGSNGYSVYGEDLAKGTYYVMIDYGTVPVEYTLTNVFTSDSPSTVPVTGIDIDKSSVEMEIGEVEYLSATVYPNDATSKSVVWSSNDTSVVTVNQNGAVTAIAPGSTSIVATCASDSTVYDICSIHVAVDSEPAGDYDEWPAPAAPVDANKTWTISFSREVDESYVNGTYFYVKDSIGNKVAQNVGFAYGDKTKVQLYSAAPQYAQGESYTLYVEKSIMAKDGSELSAGAKMNFAVAGSAEPSEGEAVLAHRGFDFSEGEFRTDADSWDAEFDARKDGAVIFWEPVEAGDEGRGEFVWIESNDEDSHQNIVADMGQVNFEDVTTASNAVFETISPALVPGHVYIVKTLEGGYAKIEVLSTDPNAMTANVKWEYSQGGEF